MFNILFAIFALLSSIGVVLALVGLIRHIKRLIVPGLVVFGISDVVMLVLIVLKFIGILA